MVAAAGGKRGGLSETGSGHVAREAGAHLLLPGLLGHAHVLVDLPLHRSIVEAGTAPICGKVSFQLQQVQVSVAGDRDVFVVERVELPLPRARLLGVDQVLRHRQVGTRRDVRAGRDGSCAWPGRVRHVELRGFETWRVRFQARNAGRHAGGQRRGRRYGVATYSLPVIMCVIMTS